MLDRHVNTAPADEPQASPPDPPPHAATPDAAPQSTRLALNFVTPLPPLATEIANHSLLVLTALAPHADVLVWTEQSAWESPAGCQVRRLHSHDIPVAALSRAPATFYNLGNHAGFHATIWQASRRAPGVVILHDTYLQNFFLGMASSPSRRADYFAMMARFHGTKAQAEAIALLTRGEGDLIAMMRNYPLTQAALEGSRGIVVHNQDEVERLRRLTASPVWHVPLAGPGSAASRPLSRRRREPLRLIVFGHIGSNRRVLQTLRALAVSSVRARYRLDIYGRVENADAVATEIESLGLSQQVALHGFVPAAQLDDALAEADLALNLRSPTLGEASSSQLRIWANALPSLVTRAGWYAGLSDDFVGFVRPEHEAEDIETHLVAFAHDPGPYIRSGLASRSHADAVHSADGYATALMEIAAELERARLVAIPRAAGESPPGEDPPDEPGTITGALDFVYGDLVAGWARWGARSGDQPGPPVMVRVFVAGRMVAEAAADQPQDDTGTPGSGGTARGFSLRVPAAASAIAQGRLKVLLVQGDATRVLLAEGTHCIAPPARPVSPPVHVDVSDLIMYALAVRNVSGIQRVQVGVLTRWLATPALRAHIRFAAFLPQTQRFHAVDRADIAWLVDNLASNTASLSGRAARLEPIVRSLAAGPSLRPGPGDTLLVTGGFWCFAGYHAALRRLQDESGLRYFQVFYDAVPILVPETCPADTVDGFSRAIVHMIRQADAAFAISHHSAGDLRIIAASLGLPSPALEVIPMGTQAHYGDVASDMADLPPGLDDFVLCVGTIEPRKNHLYLFQIWRRLLTRAGRRTPRLVCAGRPGWLSDELHRHLAATGHLDGHFVILHEVTDAQLRALYRHCLFTIYPSISEGWGLPVSESLSAGRLCVASACTSMPEAGGPWAAYLDPYDVGAGYDLVTDLIDHPEKVRAMEDALRDGYNPLTWADAADAMWGAVERALRQTAMRRSSLADPPVLALGRVHGLDGTAPTGETGPMAIARAELATIAFGAILDGPDWHAVEGWGAWAAGKIARLRARADTVEAASAVAYLRVVLPGGIEPRLCRVRANDAEAGLFMLDGGEHTLPIRLDGCGVGNDDGLIRLELTLDREPVVPGDARTLGLGFRGLLLCGDGDSAAMNLVPDWGGPDPLLRSLEAADLTMDSVGVLNGTATPDRVYATAPTRR